MQYNRVFTTSWQIAWKHKKLWLFAFFSQFATIVTIPIILAPVMAMIFPLISISQEISYDVQNFFSTSLVQLLLGTAVYVVVSVVFSIISIVGIIGLMRGVLRVNRGAEQLSVREILAETPAYFKPYGLLYLLSLAISLVTAAVLSVLIYLVSMYTYGLGFVLLSPLFLVFSVILTGVGIIINQAEIAIVADEMNLRDALRRGYLVVRHNIVVFLVISLLMGVISFVLSYVGRFASSFMFIPIFFGVILGAVLENMFVLFFGSMLSLLISLVVIPILFVISYLMLIFNQTTWMLTYLELSPQLKEKLPAEENLPEQENPAATLDE